MHRPSASTSLAVGTRNFDLISFDLPQSGHPDGSALAAHCDNAGVAEMHPYSSDSGARLFERLASEFEDKQSGATL